LGAAFQGADFVLLRQQVPTLWQRMEPLLRLSSTTPEDIAIGLDKTRPQTDPTHLSDAGAYASLLLVRPMVRLGERLVCTSAKNLFNKLHRGIPYLCLEARTNAEEQKTKPRDEFGHILECYVIWLMKQWVLEPGVKLFTNYWIQQPDRSAERDILIMNGEDGYIFEVKATVPAMKIRKFGGVADLVSLHHKAADQAFSAAEALLSGAAFEDEKLRHPIPKLKRVIPCAITYEFLAIRWPYSDCFENALRESVGKDLFSGERGIMPFQILDIQQVEVWDDLFRLPSELNLLFSALQNRASNPLKRYRDLPEDERIHFRTDYAENPGLVRKLVDAAEATSSRRLMALRESPMC
jgi:hypothetical protein